MAGRMRDGGRRPSRWPRRLAYPLAGIALSLALVAGLMTLEGWVDHRAPSISWIRQELRAKALVYAYVSAATLSAMALLGWIVGRKEDRLEELSITDPLTGLANRRRLRGAFSDGLARVARYGTPLALLLVDLDHLKEINDRRGHDSGDRALQLVAESLGRTCRATDLAARYGGDEFVVLANDTSASEALALAHRIRATVRRLSAADVRRDMSAPTSPLLTVSIGVADLDAVTLPAFELFYAAADQALYAAKAAGRDCVRVAPPESSAALELAPP
jgi:diguanylate cyclase (GGDEF)-like protein